MADLSMEIAGLKLKNPVMVASGTFGHGEEYSELIDLRKLGAIVTKSITVSPREGNPPPRIVETPAGMLNSIGLENDGLKKFIEEHLPFLAKFKTPVIANIAGETQKEFEELASTLSKERQVKALEVNISCPNVEHGGMQFGCSPVGTEEVVRAVRAATDMPLIVKLSPNVTDITEIAKKAKDSGADVISLINTVMGMAIDAETRRPRINRIVAGLSGPAIKPIALRMVWQVAQSIKLPVIGIGGIMNARDALEFFIAGASAVQIGTANFVDTQASIKTIEGINEYLDRKGIKDIKGLIGTLNK
ncbi:MAG: dihydroorotate dehydrogenase [Candidatus Margulisbacteria bacterium]|nr:dihydroorotate dehydrogenase [Candidatus Margulisiibacteriota bacterium]